MVFKDHLNREINLDKYPSRIISLVPSITELLIDLGLTSKIVGRTKFCVYPKEIKEIIPEIGGTKQVRINEIKELKPDLIFANKEENTKEIVSDLEVLCPVYVTNVQTIHSAISMIEDVSTVTNTIEKGKSIINQIEEERIALSTLNLKQHKVIYLIWQNPLMTIGIDTFIFNMLREIDLQSIVYDFRYPEISEEYIQNSEADIILLSDEPYPFKQKHLTEFNSKFPSKKVYLVDGSYFSWYGSRMKTGFKYLKELSQSFE